MNKLTWLGVVGIGLLVAATFFVARNVKDPVVVNTDIAAVENLFKKYQQPPAPPVNHESLLKSVLDDFWGRHKDDSRETLLQALEGLKRDLEKDLGDIVKASLADLHLEPKCPCNGNPRDNCKCRKPAPQPQSKWYCGYFTGNIFHYSKDNKPQPEWSNWNWYWGYFAKNSEGVETFYYNYVYLSSGDMKSCNEVAPTNGGNK